jgi:hypothetical protein
LGEEKYFRTKLGLTMMTDQTMSNYECSKTQYSGTPFEGTHSYEILLNQKYIDEFQYSIVAEADDKIVGDATSMHITHSDFTKIVLCFPYMELSKEQ